MTNANALHFVHAVKYYPAGATTNSDAGVILTKANKVLAEDVGYESEAAFNRAFKREFGLPPARYRNEHRTATGFTA